ncbi:hypothetical protein B0O99DRAFT_695963 [Bisporella sp. PMI_857]|nr:hypothetical protein B0O99DRAFT_695963 [Bisporella sp. PMI_857]
MSSAHFDNAAVTGATNPSAFGYHYGPILNNNIGWLLARQQEHIDNGGSARNALNVTVDDNADPLNAAVHLSSINTGVCGIDFRRYFRNAYFGAIINSSRVNTSIQETVVGQNAIKLYVRSGGWRNADFAFEPGRGLFGGFIDRYATTCEEIARNDAAFAFNFGTHFYRPLIAILFSSAKRKRGNDPFQSPESSTRDKGKKKSRSAVKLTSGSGSRKSTRTRASAAANEA